jgi:leucyl-tRNA synthetase
MEGAWRFLSRVWRLVDEIKDRKDLKSSGSESLIKKMHQAIKKVTDDMEGGFKFNTAISSIMELVNEIYLAKEKNMDSQEIRQAIETTVILLAAFTPHICEEMWQKLGEKGSIFKTSWPEYEVGLAREKTVTLVLQVNSKVRSRIEVPVDTAEEEIRRLALQDEKIKQWVQDSPVKKIVIVPNKLANILI